MYKTFSNERLLKEWVWDAAAYWYESWGEPLPSMEECKSLLKEWGFTIERLDEGYAIMDKWTLGSPDKRGHYWVAQRVQGGGAAVGIAYIYDGYPDDIRPPAHFRWGDPSHKEWEAKWNAWCDEHGTRTFLRIRIVEGFSPGDRELLKFDVDAYIPIEPPPLPEI